MHRLFENKNRVVATITVAGFFIGVIFHFLRIGYPWIDFMTGKTDRFKDFLNSVNLLPTLYDVNSSYVLLPLSYWVYKFFGLFGAAGGLYLHLGIFFVVAFYIFARQLGWKSFFLIALPSYPFLFAVSRTNIDLYVFLLIYGFFVAYVDKRSYLSAALLAIAVGLKPPLLLFTLFFLADTMFKPFIFCTALSALLFVVPLHLMPGSTVDQCFALFKMLKNYKAWYVVGDSGLMHGHSFFGAWKIVLYTILESRPTLNAHELDALRETFAAAFGKLSILITATTAAIILVFNLPPWRRLMLLSLLLAFNSFVSADYRLLYVYVPLIFFLKAPKCNDDRILAVLFGMILIPKQFYWFKFQHVPTLGAAVSAVLTPIILLFTAGVIVRSIRPNHLTPLSLMWRRSNSLSALLRL